MSVNNYKKLLKSNYHICIWGAGYIGLSTAVYFAKKNIKCLLIDVDKDKINNINKGNLPIPELESWFGFNIKKLTKKKLIYATSDIGLAIDPKNLVHFVAIPTEKNGKPFMSILFEVLANISKIKNIKFKYKPAIIIESTLTPRCSELKILPFLKKKGLSHKNFLYAVSPRRDWFVANTKNLEDIDRVYGSTDENSSKIIHSILSIVCKKLHKASTHKESEMVKSIENSYRHMEITLANQLSLAYPNENMREVLKLVGTKWNIGTFFPGFGTGGYCIPLSSQYVLKDIKDKKKLTLLRETIKTDNNINIKIAKSFIKKKFKKIGILGLSYKGNLKVSTLSPTIPFVNYIKKNSNIDLRIYDPYFSEKEIKKILNIRCFKFPSDLKKFDSLVIFIDHDEFKISGKILNKYLKKTRFILDNMGVWENYKLNLNIDYHISGDKNWI
jgi:nucleotide sugar dehydrogenase